MLRRIVLPIVLILSGVIGLVVTVPWLVEYLHGMAHGRSAEHPPDVIGQAVHELASALGWVLQVAALALLLGALLLSPRAAARQQRRVVRKWILPYRADEATHDDVRRLFESWHQQLLVRWWQRPIAGQRGIVLEIRVEPDGQGGLEGKLVVAIPAELEEGLEGALRACYPDARMVPLDDPPPTPGAVVRLKKRHGFIQALVSGEPRHNAIDSLLSHMENFGVPSCLQFALVPTPAFFDRWSRRIFQSREQSEYPLFSADRSRGVRSEVLGRELEGGLQVQHRPLFFGDIRIAAPSLPIARAIAGAVRGVTAGENRLVERRMHRCGRLALYRRRVEDAVTNPLPSWHHSVYSSNEIAALWHFPSPGLTTVSVRRSLVPRATASPEITREARYALMRDERALVGVLPRDRSDGLGLIGGQKTGKTSVLCQSVRVDANDPDCAVVVLMPKPGDARVALSMVPPGRTTHFLDFEHPEFGINPLLSDGDVGMVADKLVEAFRDVNAEGDIRGSSDRFLRQAAQATVAAHRAGALEEPPNLWHMYRILLPSETSFREHIVDAIYGDSRFVDTATFFGRDLPNDLRDALSNTTSKLDAPRNKILRLMVESLDKVLRHPVQLSIDEVIERREVLIVDGKMGTFGSDNCRVMMQFILSLLYGALQRQQQRPAAERVRVALKIDEAHLVVNDSFADALATLRSAGLEVVAAWQYGAQIQDPKLRAGMMSLLRQRCMFSMGESEDARSMSDIAMSVYSDFIRDDAESRSRLRLTPDVIFNLPNHRAVCSWISQGARRPAFIGETIPLAPDEERIAHHLEAQRERGGFVPDELPNPLPPVGEDAVDLPQTIPLLSTGEHPPVQPNSRRPAKSPPQEPIGASTGSDDGSPHLPATDVSTEALRPARPPQSKQRNQSAQSRRSRAGELPESFAELNLDDIRELVWDEIEPDAELAQGDLSTRELEILAALWRHGHLFASQIHRRWWPDSSLRACQLMLTRLATAGLVRRFRFVTGERGAQQRVYCLAEAGFHVCQTHELRSGPLIDPAAAWEPRRDDPVTIVHDLHVNGWVLALHAAAPKIVRNWRGPAESRLMPPKRRRGDEQIDLRPRDLALGPDRRLRDVALNHLAPIAPAGTVELAIPRGETKLRVDLIVELDRSRGAPFNVEKMRRYDALLAGWANVLPRYRKLGTAPIVAVVCQDDRERLRYLRTADEQLTARLAQVGVAAEKWPCPARERMVFVLERDVHEGTLEGLALSAHPPAIREELGVRNPERIRPRPVHLLPAPPQPERAAERTRA
jgi:hypothetical protein